MLVAEGEKSLLESGIERKNREVANPALRLYMQWIAILWAHYHAARNGNATKWMTEHRKLIAISDEYEELRRSVELQGAAGQRADSTGERAVHELRAGDGAGKTKASDYRASTPTLD